MKAVILSRVSTKKQELEGLSLDNQLETLRKYARDKGIKIVKEFVFQESAGHKIRKRFDEMYGFVKAHDEVKAILTYRVDRITRNFRDAVALDYLRVEHNKELHFVLDRLVINANSYGKDLQAWDLQVFLAKQYMNRLQEDGAVSFKSKILQGEWPAKAPIGYKNVNDSLTGKNTVILDPERSFLIKQIFELYATGHYSVAAIAAVLKKEGLRSNYPPYKSLTTAHVHNILKNPFYYGEMKTKHGIHPHYYDQLIERSLFEDCRLVREGYHKKPFKYASKPFVLRGLVKCAYCGCLISFDKKKGKYTYGCCNKYKGKCGALRVKEEDLIDQLSDLFKGLAIPKDVLADIKGQLNNSHSAEEKFHGQIIKSLRDEYDRVQRQLKVLLDMRLQESITQSEHDEKATILKSRQYEIDKRMKQHTVADEDFKMTVSYLLDVSSKAYELFQKAKVEQKRQLINFVLSNLKLEGKKLVYKLKEPFDAIIKANQNKLWLPRLDSNQ